MEKALDTEDFPSSLILIRGMIMSLMLVTVYRGC